uniref:Uncharacterized protein n=1 Tax=viral metagenome TaxID=1070528 RepID=A0A6M3IS89_9ZZZZ
MNNDITYREIEDLRLTYCEACKGQVSMLETNCYEDCSGFQDELKYMRKETTNDTNINS